MRVSWFFQSKHIGRLSNHDPGCFLEKVKTLFEKIVQRYKQNMTLTVKIGHVLLLVLNGFLK